MVANLYELMDDYAALQLAFDDDATDEQLAGLLDAMEDSKGELRVKVDNICRLLRNAETEVERFKGEEKRLAGRRKALENKGKKVREWLKSSLDLLNVDKVVTNVFEVKIIEQGLAIVVVDEDKVPQAFLRVKTTSAPDMEKISLAYKEDGEIVAGCDVVMRKAMRIR
jgi:hypothetical protein